MSLNSIAIQEGRKSVRQLGQGGMEGLPEGAGYLETHACTEVPDGGLSDDDLKKTGVFAEILSEDHLSKDSASWCQASLTKSLQRAEALLRSHLNPSFRWLLRQKEGDGSWNFENTFVTCQNLTSRSCSSFQSIERTVMDMSTHYHILWENERRLQSRGCIKGLSSSSNGDAYYHSQASAFGQQYGQLQLLLEERSKLIFLHEYSQRLRVAHSFVTKLSVLLDHERLLLVSGTQRIDRSIFMGNLGLRTLSEELRIQLNHWDVLCAKAHSDVYLRKVLLWWKEPLRTMCQTFWLLGLQSLFLMEQCIYTALCILATEHLIHVPTDALEDLLVSIQIFNHTLQDKSQHSTASWRKHVIRLSDWPYLRGCLPGIDLEPRTFTMFQLIKILAEQRGQMMAGQLCLWTSHQSDPITWSLATDNSSFDWKHPQEILSVLSNQALQHNSTGLLAQLDNLNMHDRKATKDLQSCSCCTDHPFWSFIHRDCESLDILFQALLSSTDLLLSQTPKQPIPGRPDTTETLLEDPKIGSIGLGVREPQPGAMPEKQKSVQWTDLIKSELYLEHFTQYQQILWMEFSSAAIRCFFYKGHHSVIGSMNQWRDHMMLLLILWLAHRFKREFIPVECAELLNGLCSQILYNTACMHWDEVICDALGYSLKDKCLPGAVARATTVRTATTERLVQLFNPLFMMLQHLKNKLSSGKGGRLAQLQLLDALYRSVATVQSTTFWVMSKAYQFLSSWHLNKFLLITHGDLGVLLASLKRLVQEVEDLNSKGGHSVIAPMTAQFTRGVSDLQAFSDTILRIFSMDCKRMSIEIFEQTMPSAKHWRVNYKTELPSSPSEYATSAAQSVIGQVLEGVQPLSEEARVATLTEAMTVFMEAWMEHILKQKIKFSIQGALQLKQDFDLIRDLIRSEEYSLSEELHQRLLSLRVFQQVDSAIMCLLQQPMAKPYITSQAWEPFRHCCPSITQVDQAAGSLNNLDSMDVQAACQNSLTQAQDSLTPELVSALPDSYLPLAQQEWLDLRIHNSSRWKLPGFHCLTRSEP